MASETYKGMSIHFDPSTEEWHHAGFRDKSFKNLCVRLDKELKTSFEKREAFYFFSSDAKTIKRVTVTSLTVAKTEAHVTEEDGGRHRPNVSSLYEVTPESEQVADEIDTLLRVIASSKAEIQALQKKLPRFDVSR